MKDKKIGANIFALYANSFAPILAFLSYAGGFVYLSLGV